MGFWLVIILLAGLLALSVFGNLALLAGLIATAGQSQPEGSDEFPAFHERPSYGVDGPKAVRIALAGIITRDAAGGLLFPGPDHVDLVLRQIRAARQDQEVQAIILEIDSPGGAITPTDEIYHALQKFRSSTPDRRVLVHVRDMAASGGYYVAMASDWIIAEPTAIIGSIGVIMQTLNWKTLSENIGIRGVTITAGKNKDLLNPFEEINPEHLAILQQIADDMHGRFAGIVRDRLGLDDDTLARLTDGRVYVATAAARQGMIDQIGYWDDVMDKLRELLDTEDVYVVRYEQPHSFASLLARMSLPDAGLLSSLNRQQAPRLMYLWRP
ncbi:MAG: signal peptide peptidase SppA [Lentisphaerae bacterium]|nr:signal peptide peptidase SppA [Lentisphaerota bacterium]